MLSVEGELVIYLHYPRLGHMLIMLSIYKKNAYSSTSVDYNLTELNNKVFRKSFSKQHQIFNENMYSPFSIRFEM